MALTTTKLQMTIPNSIIHSDTSIMGTVVFNPQIANFKHPYLTLYKDTSHFLDSSLGPTATEPHTIIYLYNTDTSILWTVVFNPQIANFKQSLPYNIETCQFFGQFSWYHRYQTSYNHLPL